MELERGTSLGHYEIESLVGAGGMGEVYKARDTKLGRAVAIKVLPEALAQDKERLDRFEREARLLAALNHPNIATLHGMEQSGELRFLVMELVEGETLAERIARGAIPLDEAVALFGQIAEGLEAAHERGIVHLDLKPANIKISPEGRVKILDFGLAKAFSTDGDVSGETSQSPTLTRGTALGAIMGTASYMSPEQARAKPIDKRTDIWAFGCCLYEALTGRKAFDGETVSDIIGSVLRDEPDTSSLPEEGSRLIERCLKKDPRARIRDIGDVRWELKEPVAPTKVASRPTLSFVPWLLLALATAAGLGFAFRGVSNDVRVTRYITSLPEDVRIDGNTPVQHVAFSPDGSRIVYAVRGSGEDLHLYLLERNEFTATRIPGTEGAQNPFFSPDGNWIGFFAGDNLKKISLAGGAPITICEADRSPGASWGPDDTIIYPGSYQGGLMTVSAGGGEPKALTTLAPGETGHRWPQHLPDGERILFSIRAETGTQIAVESLRTGERKTLFDESSGVTQALYLLSGHLLYDQPGSLLASAFDVDALETVSTPASVLDGAHTHQVGGLTHFAVSGTGDIVFLPSSATRTMASLRELTRDREWLELSEVHRRFRYLALDPEGQRIALNIAGDDGDGEIWLYDIVRSSLSPLSREGASYFRPVWTPDGRRVTFARSQGGLAPNLYCTPADGSGNAIELLEGGGARFPSSWTPDETALVWGNAFIIEVLRTDGGSERYMTGAWRVGAQTLSRDGRWLAYVSSDSGRPEVYVTSFPTPGARVPVSIEGGDVPRWSSDGRRLYFLSGPRIMVVDVDIETAAESFVAGVPQLVAEADVIDFDVTPDDRIIAIWPEGSRGWDRLHVVLNWFERLKELVPVE